MQKCKFKVCYPTKRCLNWPKQYEIGKNSSKLTKNNLNRQKSTKLSNRQKITKMKQNRRIKKNRRILSNFYHNWRELSTCRPKSTKIDPKVRISNFTLKIHMWVNNVRLLRTCTCKVLMFYLGSNFAYMCDDDGSCRLQLQLGLEYYHFHKFRGQLNGCHNTWVKVILIFWSFDDVLGAYLDFSSLLNKGQEFALFCSWWNIGQEIVKKCS